MLELYTAQYRYSGIDRLDITAKSTDFGIVFAPTWEMIMDYKRGSLSEEQYTILYNNLMVQSCLKHDKEWNTLLNCNVVTIVCFCKPGDFCHRLLLAKYLEKLGAHYVGERII